MALTPVQEAQVLDLIAQQSALLSLAGVEATILSKLGATKVTLSDLPTATAINDTDLLLLRQGTTDKSVTGLTFKGLIPTVADASETVKGIVELATNAEAQTGTDTSRAVTPAGIAASSLGRGQTWQNLTGSRSSGVTYTNSTGKPIQVAVSVDSQAGTQYFVVDGVNILSWDNTPAEVNHGCVVVPNGSTYVVNATIIVHWAELR